MKTPFLVRLTILAATTAVTACGGALYRVKPLVETPLPSTAVESRTNELAVRAAPILTDEESQELFESNLLLAGLLPIRVEIANNSGAPIAMEKARFLLRDAAGTEWKLLSEKKAASRILDANGVALFNPHSKKEFQQQFYSHAFDIKNPLGANDRRSGLVFFLTSDKRPVESPRGLVLTIDRLPGSIELKLN